MNHSIYSADRATHLKIVIIALVAGTALSGLTIAGHSFSDDGSMQTMRIIYAAKPVTGSMQLAIR